MLNNIVTLKSGLEVTKGHSKWYHSKAWMRFPINNSPSILTMALSCISSEIKSDIGQKLYFFHTLLALHVPVRGSRKNIAIPFGTEKLEWWGYPMMKKL